MDDTMRAWQYSAIDGKFEDCISLKDDVPTLRSASLGKDELMIEVISASLNPVDYKVPKTAILGRIMVARPATPAMDFCGRVVGKHPSNMVFEEGQLVFGGYAGPNQKGALGQYLVISAEHVASLPKGIDPDHAAAVGTAGTTAYQSLMPDTLKPGSKVFINGGSGGTGTWAIQFAKALDVEVVTTCSTRNVELCRQLGADEIIDYTKEDIIANLKVRGKVFDLVIDNVGSTTELYDNCGHYLKSGGTFVCVGVGESMSLSSMSSTMFKQLRPSIFGCTKFYFVNMKNPTEFFERIGGWMAEGKAKAVIDSTYSFEEVPEAFRKLREGRARGKIVVHVGNPS